MLGVELNLINGSITNGNWQVIARIRDMLCVCCREQSLPRHETTFTNVHMIAFLRILHKQLLIITYYFYTRQCDICHIYGFRMLCVTYVLYIPKEMRASLSVTDFLFCGVIVHAHRAHTLNSHTTHG